MRIFIVEHTELSKVLQQANPAHNDAFMSKLN